VNDSQDIEIRAVDLVQNLVGVETKGRRKGRKGSDPFSYRITAINDPVYDAVLNYDASGKITYQTRGIGDLDTGYDALDKLTDATGSLGARGYQYDRNGNRAVLKRVFKTLCQPTSWRCKT